MLFNNQLQILPVEVPDFSDREITDEPVFAKATVAEALERGRGITRFFVEEVLPKELRENPRTRLRTELHQPRELDARQKWHVDEFPNNYGNGLTGLFTVGDRRNTDVLSALQVPPEREQKFWQEEAFDQWIEEEIRAGRASFEVLKTGTWVQSNRPFIHRGGSVLNVGPRWVLDVGIQNASQDRFEQEWSEL
ncbi:MAG: hypothetical protein AAB802_04800 [Patescibacteria group bacterium]